MMEDTHLVRQGSTIFNGDGQSMRSVASALLFIILFPVIRAIVQLVVKRTTLDIQQATISSPSNDSFNLMLEGNVAHTGIFSATIKFTNPITVTWLEGDNMTMIGEMSLNEPLKAKHKRAILDQSTVFKIHDTDIFGRFAKTMITQHSFTWNLHSTGLEVHALKFPVAKGIAFDKNITLNGFNNFDGDVTLNDFQLPSDNSAGGIDFLAATELNNPRYSKICLKYRNVALGIGTGMDVNIVPGPNNITLIGILEPHGDPQELSVVSELFTNYLNGLESPVAAQGNSSITNDGSPISWLTSGLTALNLSVPLKAPSPLNPIRAIDIGSLGLAFDKDIPWTPEANSNSVQASLQLPFGFNVGIGEIENAFNLSSGGSPIAGLSTPLGTSKSSITVLGQKNTAGMINITISNTRLSCPDPQHPAFAAFSQSHLTSLIDANLTSSDSTEFRLIGHSKAIANTSIGQITLDPININVSTSLDGLQGLQGMTSIENVDVVGGTTDGINLGIEVSIFNPSNLNLAVGDLNLQLFRDNVNIGSVLLPNLTLAMGNNSFAATSVFPANNNPQGRQTLNDFVGKRDVQLKIAGFDGSTQVASLAEAFKTLDIEVTLPSLTSSLLGGGALKRRENNISHVAVSLINPFSTALQISRISSSVSSFGIPLGTINTETQFNAGPNTTTPSPSLDLNMNFDPAALFTLTRVLALDARLDVSPLDEIVRIGGIQYLPSNIFTGFELPAFVQAAFKNWRYNTLSGKYTTVLDYQQLSVPISTDNSIDFILPVLAEPIVQKIVGGSALSIETVIISNPQQTSFETRLKGTISNAGPFDAMIKFPSGLTVSWNDKILGSIQMEDIHVTGDAGATIDTQSTFKVSDVPHLTDFTKVLLSDSNFEWVISGDNLTGISVSGISLGSKKVTLAGFNGLQNGVTIQSFDLPFNDPAGGIHLTLDADTTNPSQVGIELSSIGFDTFVDDVIIASVISTSPITLSPGLATNLSLAGRLIPQDSALGLATVSGVFNSFVQGNDTSIIVQGASAGPSDVTWLNDGIKALRVATVLPNQGKLDIIQSIKLNQLELNFTTDTAYDPLASSQSTDAAFTLPFGFPLDVVALEQTITVGFEGNSLAQLAIPKGPSETDTEARIIHLSFKDAPFAVFDDSHTNFNEFVSSTTMGKMQALQLKGTANVDAQTAGLNVKPVTVKSLDVNHGFSDFLLIKVSSSLFNPRYGLELILATGDVSFDLQFQEQSIGSADIANLVIIPGEANYPIDVHFAPQDSALGAGQTLLENFIQGTNSETTIMGTQDSTPINSLKSALSQIKLSPVTIPALNRSLITSASLTFPVDIINTGIASSTFTLSNPFTASINLLEVTATAMFGNLTLGKIDDVDVSATPIRADGHSDITSPGLPIKFNLDPSTIIQLLVTTARNNGVSLGPLVQLFQFILDNPGFHPPVTSAVDLSAATCVSGGQFDVSGAILKSLAGLHVDLLIDTSLKLDDFASHLLFRQNDVPAVTDKTALFLIGAVAGPVAQHLVDQSILAFTEADITNISNDGFDLALKGSLTNTGPLDALISFTEPVTVTWEGKDIATITLNPICAAANVGVPDYETNAQLQITDPSSFTNFATFLLHNPSFEWTISTSKLRVNSLGTVFDNISLSKTVSFKAFNGLPGVSISNFQLPTDDPAGGIRVETDAIIPSSAQLSIDLGTVTFQAFFEGTLIGPLSTTNLSLQASSVTKTHLSGRIIPQANSDLATMGKLFSSFLAGENQTLETQGDSVQPSGSNGPVDWLSTAFKTLRLDVTLPGEKIDVIQSIALNDLNVTISESTLAKYRNPFGFSLQVIEAGQTIVLSLHGVDVAQLDLPIEPANGGLSTGNVVDLQISFHDQPLKSLNTEGFQQLFASVTATNEVDVNLRGAADVVATTPIGNIPISGISFNVPSSLKGINSFGGTASLSNVSVTGSGGNGGSEFIITPLLTALQNPSNISLNTVDIALPVIFNGVMLGRAAINEFDLIPGANELATEFHYMPADANDTTAQPKTWDATGRCLYWFDYGTGANGANGAGINQPTFITSIIVTITLDSLVTNLVSVEFFVRYYLQRCQWLLTTGIGAKSADADLVLELVQSDSGVNGEIFAQFTQPFTSFIVPAKGSASSGTFDNVLLTQGAIASLDIIPLGILDVAAAATVRVGQGGYQIPWLKLEQTSVPTTYNLALSFDTLKSKAAEMRKNATNSSAAPSTPASRLTSDSSASSVPSTDEVSSEASAAPISDSGKTMPTLETTVVAITSSSSADAKETPLAESKAPSKTQETAEGQNTTAATATLQAVVSAIVASATESSG
ncbi:hypothetical protein BDQ17DRAFT_1388900 [Cyathus striatus]|nr:hypothetical protein BDQ17DRAFT_1388900 [Cyathus striatus]